jgi:hypothetical protein
MGELHDILLVFLNFLSVTFLTPCIGRNTGRCGEDVRNKLLLPGCRAEQIWICYPKLTSKVKTDLTRDHGWEPMFRAGWIVVAIASVDAVWSAVRFRPKAKVKSVRFP